MIPLIIGWGDNSKKIADIGLMRCQNCSNIVGAELRELSKQINIFFLPVSKWNINNYIMCPICKVGIKINESEKKKILKETIALPANTTSIEIFNKIMVNIEQNDFQKLKNKTDAIVEELLGLGYKSDDISYVFSFILSQLPNTP